MIICCGLQPSMVLTCSIVVAPGVPALVAKQLEGLPKNKYHCSNLGAQALNKAITNYQKKHGKDARGKKGGK